MTPADLMNFAAGATMFGVTALTAALACGVRTRAARLLAAFFGCFAMVSLLGMILLGGQAWLSADAARWLRVIEVPGVYLLGPLLYGYVVALTSDGRALERRRALWHLLPCAVAFVLSVANALTAFDTTPAGRLVFMLSFHAWVLQGVPYLAAAGWRSYRVRPLLEQVSADEAALHLAWLRWLVAAIAACWVVIALERWLHEAGASDWTWLSVTFGWLTAAALYLLAWFGLRQRVLIPSEFVEARRSDRAVTPRYERSGLDAAHCALVAAELGRLVREERLYTDPDFDLRRLSECSGWPPNHVSQALNQGLCSNFFEFVNGFRVAAAKSCLADSDDRRSVLEIALACDSAASRHSTPCSSVWSAARRANTGAHRGIPPPNPPVERPIRPARTISAA